MTVSPAHTDDAETWPILLVAGNRARVDEVRHALGNWTEATTLTVVARAMPALRHALSQPVRLVIVDWALDGHSGRALVRQLARLRPDLLVLAFDTHAVSGSADQVLAWPWNELTTVLDYGLLLLLADGLGATCEESS